MADFKKIFKVVGEGSGDAPAPSGDPDVKKRIADDIAANTILIYMKGTADFPQCGFSASTVALFQQMGVPFATRNVLEDPELRQAIKEFSNWPTIPQVYIAGNFIGGCDIVTEMNGRGELESLVRSALGQ
ncbi:MAG: Grx4 family monothiol glutaredoxin [Deltaproteobacteria bacterium]|nr:Grx4 family monothiol glutaredoxin [Deltaproteobacteria bacterium]